MAEAGNTVITGRCYCGAISLASHARPQVVTYCHCHDCKRISGAPVAALAAFDDDQISFQPGEGKTFSVVDGVRRSFCPDCGSPIAARYDYLPGQVYVGVGLIDQADRLEPSFHAHEAHCVQWLHIDDDLERFPATSRSRLSGSHENMERPQQ